MKSLLLVPVALLPWMVSCAEKPRGGSPADAATTAMLRDGSPGDAAAVSAMLCDGRDGLRVRISLEGGEPDQTGSYIRINHGFSVLEIDGQCGYSMNSGWQFNLPQFRDRGWRTGTLDRATAAALQSALPLADLRGLADCVASGVIGASGRMIRTATSQASCDGTGPRFERAWAVVTATADQLWPRSSPMDGPIRVSARETAPPPGTGDHQPYVWPLGPLSPFVQADSAGLAADAHTLVSDPESARRLRALRETYLADRALSEAGFSGWNGVRVSDGTITAVTFMRDALPFEDQAGHPPF
jgi:hypothetical protein